ncbi:hypothetical protein E3N88_25900 [Mikania micrantha]|uniref:Reverse transcriptase domain-containing protein n=1 Tax=Mikania micrantha TaxID=192012 RepID=A0A5N6N8T1_9ASTR|nr:hypothetical protein E3N88_25900 [Mikania micrantha]
MDREVKQLKQSKIPIVKVRWNSKRGPKFTWEREDQMMRKYPHLFKQTTINQACKHFVRHDHKRSPIIRGITETHTSLTNVGERQTHCVAQHSKLHENSHIELGSSNETKRCSNDVLQSRNGRERAQNNKIGLVGLTFGPGATPDPEPRRYAMRARHKRSLGCLTTRASWKLETIEGRPLDLNNHHHLLVDQRSCCPGLSRAASTLS